MECEPRNERKNACRGTSKASSSAGRLPNSPQARMKPRKGVNFGRNLFPPSLPFVSEEICSYIIIVIFVFFVLVSAVPDIWLRVSLVPQDVLGLRFYL